MRSQATDTAAPAQASVQPRTARRLVDMLYMSEAETRQLFLDAEILIRTEGGGYRISVSELELLFGARAVVMEGPLPGEYCPKILPRSRVQEQGEMDLGHLPEGGSQGGSKQTLPRIKRACVRAQVARSASAASGHAM